MGHEISQFDILDRQLLTINPQPRANKWSDLGEAKISRTILGGAKVRVIREQDRKRRAWLLAALVAIAITVAAWQGWITYQKEEVVVPPLPLSERIQVSQPVFAPETIAPDPHPSRRKSVSLIQTEINGLLSGPLPKRPPSVVQATKPVVASPAVSEQAKSGKPAALPLARIQNTAKPEIGMQPPARLSATQPAAKTISATPQPARAIPASVAPLDGAPIKDDSPEMTSTGSASAGIIQPDSPANKQTATTTQPAINTESQINAQTQANAEPQVNSEPPSAEPEVNARGTSIIFVEPGENTQAVSK